MNAFVSEKMIYKHLWLNVCGCGVGVGSGGGGGGGGGYLATGRQALHVSVQAQSDSH